MKLLGNLAIVCSRNKNCLLRVYDGRVELFCGEGPERLFKFCSVDDDEAIGQMIELLNFGRDDI